MHSFDTVLETYCRGTKEQRSAALAFLTDSARTGSLSAGQLAQLLSAASRPMEPGEYSWSDPASNLIYIIRDASRQNPAIAPSLRLIREAFGSSAPKTRPAMLQLLTTRPDAESARAYIAALRGELTGGQYPFPTESELLHIDTFSATPLSPFAPQASPEVAAVLFPALLDAARHPTLVFPIFSMLLGFLEQKLLEPQALAGHEAGLASLLSATIGSALATQQENRPGHFNWKYEPPYTEHRDLAALLLDVAGHWNAPAIRGVLSLQYAFTDPRLALFHATSRLSLGIPVSDEELAAVAQSSRELYMLHSMLADSEHTGRLPAACRDQQNIARGNMVDWLCFGTELGREPDEIELVHVETVREGWFLRRGKPRDYFFFRFRVTEEHWSKERGWTVGMAGGYPRTPGGTTLHDGGTFSKFESWESKSLKDHVKSYLS